MRYLLFLVFVLGVIGLAIVRNRSAISMPSVPSAIAAGELQNVIASGTSGETGIVIKHKINRVSAQATAKLKGLLAAAQATDGPHRAPQSIEPESVSDLTVKLSHELIATMEQHWSELPRQARITREDRGWRIVSLQNNSWFARAGLQSGDLITKDQIESLIRSDNTDESELALRWERILDRISQ